MLKNIRPLRANLYKEITNLQFWGQEAHISKATMIKSGVRVWTWDSSYPFY